MYVLFVHYHAEQSTVESSLMYIWSCGSPSQPNLVDMPTSKVRMWGVIANGRTANFPIC